MNYKTVCHITGQLIKLEAALLLLPLIVSAIYSEKAWLSFLITMTVGFAVGLVLSLIGRGSDQLIYAKEGFAVVALAWVLMSAIGALPFFISGEIKSYADAFFETVSGFTTTGASILTDIESMSRGLLFWRSFTHWIGGMGVLVLMMAILPTPNGRSIHIMRAEVPGPVVGKLVPRIRDTAKILYLLYIALTVFEIIMLLAGGMPVFDSIVHTFGTAGTGGFGIKSDSIAGYSHYLQWVITVFMLLFGINFNLYYLILLGKFRTAFKNAELWTYFIIVLVSVAAITINITSLYSSFEEAFRLSSFQVASIITTTGYSTADFNLWPGLSKAWLVGLMLIGGCAGSTAGGLKVSRIIIIFKMVRANLRKMIHPRSVSSIRIDGKKADEETLRGLSAYFMLYCIILVLTFIALSFEPFDFETNMTAAISCLNNVGPGLGLVGPAGSYADYSAVSKLILSAVMLIGRLEIYPIMLALIPSTWSRK